MGAVNAMIFKPNENELTMQASPQRPVTLIDRPCSRKAKKLLADPEPGSVYLMENLKFYPAEYGIDAEPREVKKPDAEGTGEAGDPAHEGAEQEAEAAEEKGQGLVCSDCR